MNYFSFFKQPRGHGKDVRLFEKGHIFGIKQRKHLRRLQKLIQLEMSNTLLKIRRIVGTHHSAYYRSLWGQGYGLGWLQLFRSKKLVQTVAQQMPAVIKAKGRQQNIRLYDLLFGQAVYVSYYQIVANSLP